MSGLAQIGASHNAKEIVALAKQWVKEQYADELIDDIGLEEVRFSRGYWYITIGFSRPWDNAAFNSLGIRKPRSYKIVKIQDNTATVESMKNRDDD